jgi:hypothetical protein
MAVVHELEQKPLITRVQKQASVVYTMEVAFDNDNGNRLSSSTSYNAVRLITLRKMEVLQSKHSLPSRNGTNLAAPGNA